MRQQRGLPSSISELPPEIIDLVNTTLDTPALKSARLVNRQWCTHATKCLFRTITMTPTDREFRRWQGVLNNNSLRAIPTRAVLNTFPIPEYGYGAPPLSAEDYDNALVWKPDRWARWNDEKSDSMKTPDLEMERWCESYPDLAAKYQAFYSTFSDLRRLPALQKADLYFTPLCISKDHVHYRHGVLEPEESREDLLWRFITSLKARMENPENSLVRSVCIRNLQNTGIKITGTSDFRTIMSKVHDLNLLIARDCSTTNVYILEQSTFTSILKDHWLTPASSSLRSLSIDSHDCWGSLPERLNWSRLKFPQLRHLSLGHYCLAFNDSLDWILTQTTLEYLGLKRCQIAAYMILPTTIIEKWNVKTAEWTLLYTDHEMWLDDDGEGYAFFHYPGTWADCFDRIRTRLPRLTEFLFQASLHSDGAKHTEIHELSARRYVAFHTEESYYRWAEADSSGDMPSTYEYDMDECKLNRHKETLEADEAALARLSREIQKRRCDS